MSNPPPVVRPTFLACGDSITQYGFHPGGWVEQLHHSVDPKGLADVKNRGFAGYTTRWFCQQILPSIHVEPNRCNLATICFGANDSVLPNNPIQYSYQHVPLDEFNQNLETIIDAVSAHSKIVLLTPPPNDGLKHQQFKGNEPLRRRLEYTSLYADAVVKLGQTKNLVTIDLFTSMQRESDWSTRFFYDGLHLTAAGNDFVFTQIIQALPTFQQDCTDPWTYWKEWCLANLS